MWGFLAALEWDIADDGRRASRILLDARRGLEHVITLADITSIKVYTIKKAELKLCNRKPNR
jgi:hypothetical protein